MELEAEVRAGIVDRARARRSPAGQFASVDDAALGASLKLNPTLIPANLTLNIAAR